MVHHTFAGQKRLHDRTSIDIKHRARELLPGGEIQVPRPPNRPSPPNKPAIWLMITTPLMTGAFAAITIVNAINTGSQWWYAIPMIAMAIMVPLGQIVAYRSGKKKYQKQCAEQDVQYAEVLEGIEKQLSAAAAEQARILVDERPSLTELQRRVSERTKMWDHLPTHEDFLSLRIGTVQQPLSVAVKTPDPDPFNPDMRVDSALEVAGKYRLLDHMPLRANLGDMATIGINAAGRIDPVQIAYTMLANLLVLHGPQHVHLYTFCHRRDAGQRWGWLKWAPHVNALTGDGSNTRLGFSPQGSERLLTALRQELQQREMGGALGMPYLVVVFDDAPEALRSPAVSQIMAADPKLQACGLFLGSTIPPNCNAYVAVKGSSENPTVEYVEMIGPNAGVRVAGSAELASIEACESIARGMAPLRMEAMGAPELPGSVRLVEVLGVSGDPTELAVDQLYSNTHNHLSYIDFPIGLERNLRPMRMRLGELPAINGMEDPNQGLHGMLAGTTGAGKSVTLESIILSMVANYSPEQVNVLIADFKGGASQLKKLRDLPHCAGYISDLSPAMAERARVALESEARYRQELMAAAGEDVKDIASYNRKAEEPLPRLIIVLDEFARALKMNPDFRRTMDVIAAQGRAFGMHLLLSTQKAADFDDKLRTNMQYRVSLRVESREDSMTMLRRDEAYRIPPYRRGRGYLQVGDNAVFEEFQSARADTVYNPEGEAAGAVGAFKVYRVESNGARTELLRHSGLSESEVQQSAVEGPSDGEVLIRKIVEHCEAAGYRPARQIYLEELPEYTEFTIWNLLEQVPVLRRCREDIDPTLPDDLRDAGRPPEPVLRWWAELEDPSAWLRVPVGSYDLPARRIQDIWRVDLNAYDGNLMVIGTPGSGKAMFLQALITGLTATHSPQDLNFYFLDFGPRTLQVFGRLPHSGGVFLPTERERVGRLLAFLEGEIAYRTNMLAQAQVSTPEEFRAIYPDYPMPAIVIVLDSYAKFKDEYPDDTDVLINIVRGGKAADIHLVVTADLTSEITMRLRDLIMNRVAFQMVNQDDYRDLFAQRPIPIAEVVGRGVIRMDEHLAEVQVAAPVEDPFVPMSEQLAEVSDIMYQSWGEKTTPQEFYALPSHVEFEPLLYEPPPTNLEPDSLVTAPIGYWYADLSPCVVDLESFGPFGLVIGPPQSGKTEFLVTLALAATARVLPDKLDIVIIDYHGQHLRGLRRMPGVTYIPDHKLGEMLPPLVEMLNDRAAVGRRLRAQGTNLSVRDTPEKLPRTLILVDDLQSLVTGDKEALNALNELAAIYRDARISLFVAALPSDVMRHKAMNAFIQRAGVERSGVVFSNDSNDHSHLGVNLSVAERRLHASLPPGRGFLVRNGQADVVQFATIYPAPAEEVGGPVFGRGSGMTDLGRADNEDAYQTNLRRLITLISGGTMPA